MQNVIPPHKGSSDANGNADTKNERLKYVCGLGIEGVFGGINELTKGATVIDGNWEITDPDGSTRRITSVAYDGWISGVAAEDGPFFDMIPTRTEGSESTYYSDRFITKSFGVFVRSNSDSDTEGGVACVDSEYTESERHFSIGSRLAFRGVIREAASVNDFKALAVL